MLCTEWVAPGEGEPAGLLLSWIGGTLIADSSLTAKRTSLKIVRVGPPEPYDVERAVEALRRVGVF